MSRSVSVILAHAVRNVSSLRCVVISASQFSAQKENRSVAKLEKIQVLGIDAASGVVLVGGSPEQQAAIAEMELELDLGSTVELCLESQPAPELSVPESEAAQESPEESRESSE